MTAKTADGGKLADPEWRRERAIKAARARTSIDAHIAAIEEKQDDLTPEQRDRLAKIVAGRPVSIMGRRDARTYVGKSTAIVTMQCEGQRTIDDQLRENGM